MDGSWARLPQQVLCVAEDATVPRNGQVDPARRAQLQPVSFQQVEKKKFILFLPPLVTRANSIFSASRDDGIARGGGGAQASKLHQLNSSGSFFRFSFVENNEFHTPAVR